MRKLSALLVVAALALGALGAPAAAATHTIKGTLTDSKVASRNGVCIGSRGYNDMRVGTQVVVRNGSGKTIATSALRMGKGIADPQYRVVVTCRFPFTVKNLPDSKFYEIEVSHRGGLTSSRKQLEKMKWKVAFTLG